MDPIRRHRILVKVASRRAALAHEKSASLAAIAKLSNQELAALLRKALENKPAVENALGQALNRWPKYHNMIIQALM